MRRSSIMNHAQAQQQWLLSTLVAGDMDTLPQP